MLQKFKICDQFGVRPWDVGPGRSIDPAHVIRCNWTGEIMLPDITNVVATGEPPKAVSVNLTDYAEGYENFASHNPARFAASSVKLMTDAQKKRFVDKARANRHRLQFFERHSQHCF